MSTSLSSPSPVLSPPPSIPFSSSSTRTSLSASSPIASSPAATGVATLVGFSADQAVLITGAFSSPSSGATSGVVPSAAKMM